MDLNRMTRAMLRTMPDPTKKYTRETFYVDTGFREKETGRKYLADKDCSCGGRGYPYVAVPVGQRRTFILCKCVVVYPLEGEFYIRPKGGSK